MKAFLILNQQAGTQSDDDVAPPDICAALAAAGIDVTLKQVTPPTIDSVLRAAVARKPDAIIVGGGDGTLSTAAGHLVDTKIPLGALPLGTFNHFAKDIGMSADWREAISSLAGAAIRPVDVGEVNRRVFLNNCSLGAYPEAVHHREMIRQRRGRGKNLAMFLAFFRVFRRLRRMRLTIETAGESSALRAPFVLVANNHYSGHVFDANLRERLDEGRLWLYTTQVRRHMTLLRLMWQCLVRRLDDADDLERRPVTEAVINSAGGEIPVAVDGEPVDLKPPLRFRIRPRALYVLSPNPSPKA